MKRLIIVLVILSVILTGCGLGPTETLNPTETEEVPTDEGEDTPEVVLPKEPPEDVTWISPGKVQVGNFYPGARAEWDVLVHNGNDTDDSFAVTYRHPDHVGEGYSLPVEEVQDWVIVADTTPVLMPRETKEILVVLEMPDDIDRWSIPVWNLSKLGVDTRDELRIAYQEDIEKAIEEDKEELPRKPELLLFLEEIDGVVVGSEDVSSDYADYIISTDENKWEFWVSVKDTTQTGTIQTELCCRWLITMRQ